VAGVVLRSPESVGALSSSAATLATECEPERRQSITLCSSVGFGRACGIDPEEHGVMGYAF
jgi:hypothetical protein